MVNQASHTKLRIVPADRLHAGLLIIRDDGHRVAWLLHRTTLLLNFDLTGLVYSSGLSDTEP